jgi:glycosyltransferase involved in cell wall biosynthesis
MAFKSLAATNARLHLVLAGTANAQSPLPSGERIHYLGQLPHDRIPLFNAALDVGVICIRDTPFGRYSFPQKAYEMAAARIPLVVAAVGAMRDVFEPWPQCLYDPAQPDSLRQTLARQIVEPIIPVPGIPDWDSQAERWEKMLQALV